MRNSRLMALLLALILTAPVWAEEAVGDNPPPFEYAWATAYHILPETTSDESGYFALSEGLNHRMYVGTAKYGENSFLVEFDPKTEKQRIVVDVHKLCGIAPDVKGYAAQAKIHTRSFVGPSGVIYIGSKQGYRLGPDDTADYPGGYVMTYDPKTDTAESLGVPYPGQGVIDTVADETHDLIYIVTCEEQHWMTYDVAKKEYHDLKVSLTPYATTLVDHKGRANAITNAFRMARHDPTTGKTTLHDIMIDGEKWEQSGRNAIPTWQLAADGRTAYLVLMNEANLYRLDIGGEEPVVHGTKIGSFIDMPKPDTRCALSIAPDGRVYALIRVNNNTGFGGGTLHFLLRYTPETYTFENLGVLAVKNPDFYDFAAKKPWSHGYHTLPDGTLTPLHSHMALVVGHDHTVWVTILHPFSLLKIDPIP